ncbi:succinyl-diaminopimelate desuccinylase [Desulfobaculum xiamenense]|uniref:Succinyl-diaminopimelate desuccinylase n=1 Tax=Desulfobaculum xiamenense TaxID=995050 RepID=A0A846QEP3_9BACT|nr:M20 family metallo-hydrolase [Desulfobaculum xiamenense]NJB66741.1 succinyl-diaminopimelate desuccinylase [Desulfobaculum xiamenense]
MLQSVLNHIDTQRDSLVDLQRKLVAIPALGPANGGPGEKAKADFLIDYLRGIGITDITEYNAPDEQAEAGYRPNLVARIPGTDTSRTLWIIGHIDIVPAGDLSLWDSDPFELRLDGDVMYGRGVEDDHCGFVPTIMLAKSLIETGTTPPMNLGIMMVADEETSSRHGLGFLVEKHPELFGENDLFVVPDMGSPDSTQIEIAEKSSMWVKVTVIGRQCHASTPLEGVNSLVAAAAFITSVYDLYDEFPDSDDLFEPSVSTFEPTKKEANVPNINTIPGKDVFYIDCRVLPQYELDDVFAVIRAIGEDVEDEYGVRCEFEKVQADQAAPATSMDAEVVTRLQAAIGRVYGVEGMPVGVGGGTVAAFLRRMGRDAVVWSTMDGNAHQPNEHARISHQLGDAKVYAEMLFGE